VRKKRSDPQRKSFVLVHQEKGSRTKGATVVVGKKKTELEVGESVGKGRIHYCTLPESPKERKKRDTTNHEGINITD